MTKKGRLVVAATIGGLAVAVLVWPTIYRYERVALFPGNAGSYLVRINRLTGSAAYLSQRGWNSLEAPALDPETTTTTEAPAVVEETATTPAGTETTTPPTDRFVWEEGSVDVGGSERFAPWVEPTAKPTLTPTPRPGGM